MLDWHYELARRSSISSARVHFILKKELKVNKICARWIPHLLTKEQKVERVRKAKKLLKLYPEYDRKRFAELITGDETLVHYFEPRRKCLNSIWASKHSRRPVIAKRLATVRKSLYCIFFSIKGPAIQVVVPRRKNDTAKYYRKAVLQKQMNRYFCKQRPKKGMKQISLLHDNASSHKAKLVTEYLARH